MIAKMEIADSFSHKKTLLRCGSHIIDFSVPKIMGILNITPDSFFRGSRCSDADKIIARTHQMLSDGVDIIDIGAYSSRPNASPLSEDEELSRLLPALKLIKTHFPFALISVDTFRANIVQRIVADFGAIIVNDISCGEADKKMLTTVAKFNLPYVAMHMRGTPQNMQQQTIYPNGIITEVIYYLSQRLELLFSLGIADVIIDPGFGFAKTTEQSFEMLANLSKFNFFQLPLLIGISRKSMISKTLDIASENALNGTTALHMWALQQGANVLRVHDVKEAAESIKIYQRIKQYQS
ncbi:MAG: dihydropteroate synthase [Bacteroidales bacterium]